VDGITIDGDDDNNGDDDQQEGNEDAAEEDDEEEELGDNGGAGGVTGMDTEMITPKAKSVSNGNAKKACVASLGKEPVVCSQEEQMLGKNMGQKTQNSLEVAGNSKEREAHVMSRLIGELVHKPMSIVLEKKSLEENVGTHLLQRFDEESEEDEQPVNTQAVVCEVPVAAMHKAADKGKKDLGYYSSNKDEQQDCDGWQICY
jgi:hypothetical protein